MIKPGEIRIKNPEILRRLMEHTYDDMLIEIICNVATHHGVYITEAWRRQLHQGDVHGTDPGRGVDLRTRVYPDPQAVEADINSRYVYDPGRPDMKVAIIHDVGNGKHMHVQSHPRTRRR